MDSFKYTMEELLEAVSQSNSYTAVLDYLRLSVSGDSVKTLKRVIKDNHISVEHFTIKISKKSYSYVTPEILINEYLKKGTKVSSNFLRKKLIQFGFKEDKCEICGMEDWQDQYVVKQLHHKNKDKYDNRLENLILLCPVCHTQQHSSPQRLKKLKLVSKKCIVCGAEFLGIDSSFHNKRCYKCSSKKEIKPLQILSCKHCKKTFKPKRKSTKFCCKECKNKYQKDRCSVTGNKIKRPLKEDLEKLVWQYPDTVLGSKFGVSPPTVSNWCTELHIKRPPLGYWNRNVNNRVK